MFKFDFGGVAGKRLAAIVIMFTGHFISGGKHQFVIELSIRLR